MANWRDRVLIRQGDITAEVCDAIVNAANERLAPGGGVCGAIHAAAGPRLAEACRRIGGCPTGAAVVTDAYDLPCRKVIHTVGPVYGSAGGNEADLLTACYRESLRLAAEHDLAAIAFPSISTGIFGYPIAAASRIALAAVRDGLEAYPSLEEVRLICFSAADREEYERAFADLG